MWNNEEKQKRAVANFHHRETAQPQTFNGSLQNSTALQQRAKKGREEEGCKTVSMDVKTDGLKHIEMHSTQFSVARAQGEFSPA